MRRILLLPDLHAPYHHEQAFECFLDVARGWEPHELVCLGDFGDLPHFSRFIVDPRQVIPFNDERKAIRNCVKRVSSAVRKGCKKTFLTGNHDARIDRYILERAPLLTGWRDVADLYDLDRHGWDVLPYKRSYKIGKLLLSHDFGRAGVNAARQSVNDVGHSVGFGHTHGLNVHYQGTTLGERHVGATFGWLGDPEKIDYLHRDRVRRSYIHGLGTVHVLDDGRFWLQAIPIVEGECVVDGVVYGARTGKKRARKT
jgi:hypothetical protein